MNDIRAEIVTALHPERNGVLIKKGVAEGANLEDIVVDELEALLEKKVREARTKELEMLPVMRRALHTPQKELDIILVDTVNKRLQQPNSVQEKQE